MAVSALASSSVGDDDLACFARIANASPDEFVSGIAPFDWASTGTVSKVTAVPLKAEQWLGVARRLEDRNPTAALKLYVYVAEKTTDRALQIGVAANALALARRKNAADAVLEMSDLLVNIAANAPADKLAAVGALAGRGEEDLVGDICGEAGDPRLAWPCAESNPEKLPQYLDAIAELPVLSFSDAERLAKIDGARQLRGLACRKAPNFRPDVEQVLRPQHTALPLRAEPAIYYRLSLEAPGGIAQCFLEAASVACAQLVVNEGSCPVPYVIAEYAKTLPPAQQKELIQAVIVTKNSHYALLNAGHPGEEDILFHLHLIAAELLAASELARDTKLGQLWQPQYHVARAFDFYRPPDPDSRFVDLLTPELRTFVCDPGSCSQVCRGSSRERDCRAECAAQTRHLAPVCAP